MIVKTGWRVLACLAGLTCIGLACGPAFGEGRLLLKSGFEDGVRITDDMQDIVGVDAETGFDWDATPAWIDFSHFVYLVNRDKELSDYMASSIETAIGPFGNETRVLRMQNKADDPDHGSTSRNEYSFFMKPEPDGYRQGYVRYWMKLQGNLGDLFPKDQASPWYMVMEWKEPNSGIVKSRQECKACGERPSGSNNYRINVHIQRAAGETAFHWYLTGEHPQPCRKTEWKYVNPDVEVPLGRWFLVEGYMKKDHTNGRVYFAVDGRVVLDTDVTRPEGFVGRTEHADNPLPLRFWSPMKNYHSMDWNAAGPISQWYDEFELWSDFPAGHPALRERNAKDSVIFEEHFDGPDRPMPDGWWSEGDGAEIRNGRLYVNADRGRFRKSTTWLNRTFSGDLRVEYDVCVLGSADTANNINFLFLYSDPSGVPLLKSRQSRADGRYAKYHELNGYIFTNVANGDGVPARFRFRDCPGFHLLAESHEYENRPHTVYHVTIEKRGKHLTYSINGHVALDANDEQFEAVHNSGLIGFRTWHTELWWDNLVVTQLQITTQTN